MAIQTPALNSFAAGELSPLLDGRTDLAKYYVGLKTLLNMIVYPYGGTTRRGGTKFINEVKDSSKKTRLLPFEFSTTQAYMIEMGDQYMRFYMNQGAILWTADPNQASHTFDTVHDWTDLSALAGSGGQIGWNSASKTLDIYAGSNVASGWAEFQFANLSSPTVDHQVSLDNQNQATPIMIGVGDVRTRNSASFDLFAIAEQNAGTVTISFDPNGATQVYVSLINQNAGSATVDNVTLRRKYYEISSPYVENDLFKIKIAQSADTMFLAHASYKPRELTRTGHQSFSIKAVPFINDPFAATGDYPSTVSFFEGRSVWAATDNEPQTIWLSESTDIRDISVGSNDASAIKATIAALKVNRIRWLIPLKVLLFGTVGGEWRIGATTTAEPVTPTNISARQEGVEGSANVLPLITKNEAIFVQYHSHRVMRISYDFEKDGYLSDDITLLSEHIVRSENNSATLVELAFAQYPNRIIWGVRSDGVLIGCTYNRAQDIVAWHRHTTGLSGQFESVAVIPGAARDETWTLVKRTVAGATKRYIEVMADERINTITDGRWLDSYLEYIGDNSSSVIALSGLDHLNGASVDINADGAWHPARTVANGSITLQNWASQVVAGIAYTSEMETMRLEAGSQLGTALGKIKRIARAIILFYKSAGCQYGTDWNNMDVLPWRSTSDEMDAPPALITEAKEIVMPGDWERANRIKIRQSLPLPLTVLAIIPHVDTSEE